MAYADHGETAPQTLVFNDAGSQEVPVKFDAIATIMSLNVMIRQIAGTGYAINPAVERYSAATSRRSALSTTIGVSQSCRSGGPAQRLVTIVTQSGV
jgi:hypothetical protein